MTSETKNDCVLAVDPGRRKCGLAVVSAHEGILYREVVPCAEFVTKFRDVYEQHSPDHVLLGGSTGSKEIAQAISEETDADAELVDERHTTELAKIRYFKEFPPKGLWRLVPIGLQTPPTCYDDFAAVVLAERYLKEQTNGK
jgi:RNase H-fold protein (predicted Holliday junction resolvase)